MFHPHEQLWPMLLLRFLLLVMLTASSNHAFFVRHRPHDSQRLRCPGWTIQQQAANHESASFSFGENDESDLGSTRSTIAGLGGNYVGYYATFDSRTGELIPIPEQYIPDSLLEWGQVPSCLEVLVVEQKEKGEHSHYNRITHTILPETGCAVDNLETLITSESLWMFRGKNHFWQSADKSAWLIWTDLIPEQRVRIECGFGWAPEEEEASVLSDCSGFRKRIAIEMIPQSTNDYSGLSWHLVSPVRVWLERRIPQSILDLVEGGGLDGRTISSLLGSLRVFEDFASMNAQPTIKWQSLSSLDNLNDESLLFLPGNWTLAVAKDDGHVIEIGHIDIPMRRDILTMTLQSSGEIKAISGRREQGNLLSTTFTSS